MSRIRGYCFTAFVDNAPEWNETRMRYLLFAPETCPETGKHHWQGYVYYKEKVSIKTSQKLLGCGKCHHQVSNGTADDNYTYIVGPYTKDDKVKPYNPKFKEYGDKPTQGKRVDLIDLKEKLLKGETTINNVLTDDPQTFHQYGRTLERLDDLRMSGIYRTTMTTAEWLWGPTGGGKSHRAFVNFSPDTHYVYPNDNGWWDNYKQQETVIFNDFRGELSYNELLQMIDKWPYTVKRRGRPPLPFTSKHVIITSSLPPKRIYKHRCAEDSLEQLYRRCVCVAINAPDFTNYGDLKDDS
ncbi:MAG: helicase [Cressdnaviricota sp.]|nr:MAG: helicase [Cressdnaviricota sp.]